MDNNIPSSEMDGFADSNDRKRKHDDSPQRRQDYSDENCCDVLVANVPYEFTWQDMKDLVRDKVGEVNHVRLWEDEFGKPKGAGFLTMPTPEMATKAVETLNRYEIQGRLLVVKKYTEDEKRKRQRMEERKSQEKFGNRGGRYSDRPESMRGPPGPRGGPGHMDDRGSREPPPSMAALINTIQSSDPAVLRKLGVNDNVIDAVRSGSLSDTVFIANVDYSMKWQEIKDVFKLAGRVVHVKMTEDSDGKSKGYGIVQFSSPFEALEAVAKFHGQMLKDRRLTVKMDKFQGEKSGHHVLPKGLSGMGSSLSSTLSQLNPGPPRGGWDGPGGMPMPPMDDRGPGNMMQSNAMPMGGHMGGGPLMPSMAELEMERIALQREREKLMMGGSHFPDRGPGMMPHPNPEFPIDRGLGSRLGSGPAMSESVRGFGNPMASSSFGMSSGSSGFSGLPESNDPRERELILLEELKRLRAQLGSGVDQRGPVQESFSRDFPSSNRAGNYNMGNFSGSNYQPAGFPEAKSETNPALAPGFGRGQISGIPGLSGMGSSQIFIRNLPFQVNWQMLKDRFAEFGKVLFAEIKMENGRSKGCGIVKFSSPQEAERAISMMNGKIIDGREIEVRFDSNA